MSDCHRSGPSSNIVLTRTIRRALGQDLQANQGLLTSFASPQHVESPGLTVSRPRSPSRDVRVPRAIENVDATTIPEEPEISDLFRQFFRETGILFPYINEQRFWETYEAFQQSGKSRVRTPWLGLMNMVLAMATSTHTNSGLSTPQRYAQSETYFKRAKAICLNRMMTGASVEAGERARVGTSRCAVALTDD